MLLKIRSTEVITLDIVLDFENPVAERNGTHKNQLCRSHTLMLMLSMV